MDFLSGASVGVSALGTVAQYYQNEKALKANQDRLDDIEGIFNALKPPEYDVKITDAPELISKSVPEPALNYSALTPEQFKSVGKYIPEIAPYIAEKAPELVKASKVGQEGKQAQLDALRELKTRATSTGIDPLLQSQLDAASQKGQIDAQSRGQSILQDANRRGQGGSGIMLAQQLQAASDSAQRQAQESQAAALAAYQSKLQALRDSASLGSDISQQDLSLQAQNAGILNDFNQRTSKNANAYGQYASGLRNEAQQSNLATDQGLANKNTQMTNEYAATNRDMANKGAMANYQNALNERDYQNKIKQQGFQNQMGLSQAQNQAKSMGFGNQYQVAQGKAGLTDNILNQNAMKASNMNKLIQGGVDAFGGYAAKKQAEDDEELT